MTYLKMPGKIGSYRPIGILSVTDFHIIYKAESRSGRKVAIKMPLSTDEAAGTVLCEEYRTLRLLHSPCFPEAVSIGRHAGQIYLAESFLEGETLAKSLEKSGPLSAIAAVNAMLAISRGLLPLWARGSGHMDIRPANIMVLESKDWALFDFHLPAAVRAGRFSGKQQSIPLDYSPPERNSRHPVMPRYDFYAIGLTLYEAVLGRPFIPCSDRFLDPLIVKSRLRHFTDIVMPLEEMPLNLREFLCRVCHPDLSLRIIDHFEFLRELQELARKI